MEVETKAGWWWSFSFFKSKRERDPNAEISRFASGFMVPEKVVEVGQGSWLRSQLHRRLLRQYQAQATPSCCVCAFTVGLSFGPSLKAVDFSTILERKVTKEQE